MAQDGSVRLRLLVPADERELRRIHAKPEVARWWGLPPEGFPWSDEPQSARLAIDVDGRVVGLVQYWEERDPAYRHASIDVFVDPSLHGGGLGPRALRLLIGHLVREHGHHRVTIDPAADNAVAIRAYEKAGFRRVGVMRQYERDADGRGWHDGLLMEWVADP